MSAGFLRPGLALEGRRVLVLGLAVTGRAVAKVLAGRGAEVLASELADLPRTELEDLVAAGVEVETGAHEHAARRLDTFDFVVPSPGISPRTGFLADVVARGAPIVSELDLAVCMTNAPVVAVTGTNGKTTVCRLAERIGRQAGWDAHACGNTEVPFLSAVAEHPDADLYIVEASSFRLAYCELFHPRVAIFTNLAPDHLDWHGTFDDYRAAKARIATRQQAGDLFLFPSGQPELASIAPPGPERVAFAHAPLPLSDGREPNGAWCEGDEIVVRLPERAVHARGAAALATHAPHFAADAAAAAAALVYLGAEPQAIEQALRSFSLDHHRLEPVGVLDGVRVYDDSKATNPHATVAALRAFERVVLIAGGRTKGIDLAPLVSEASRLRTVVALGEAAPELERVFAETGVPVKTVGSMAEAVAVAFNEAVPPDVVLLSPACASFDMFSSYGERGRVFRDACRALGVRG